MSTTTLFFLLLGFAQPLISMGSEKGSESPEAQKPRPTTFSKIRSAPDTEVQAAILRYQNQAKQMGLAQTAQWIKMGHYKDSWIWGWESEVDGMDFFLDPDGREDPETELLATIDAFFEPLESDDEEQQHPICHFPARFKWLKAQLNFDEKLLSQPKCQLYEQYLRILKAQSASLVFSAYYMDSPSSTFGHTFLRISREQDTAGSNQKRYELLDYGVNYGAAATTQNPILYALFGIVGIFKGSFSKIPYYYKVREYNDFETRDLWAYELDLTHEQLQRLVDHLWEMGSTYFDYFFFTENCSYHILGVLDVALPEANLAEAMPYWVIPSDTIKEIMDRPGLVKSIHHRPSIRTQFDARLEELDPSEVELLKDLWRAQDLEPLKTETAQSLKPERTAKVLDTLVDFLDFSNPDNLVAEDKPTDSAKWRQSILMTRARLKVRSPDLEIPPPIENQPHRGHGSARFGVVGGHQKGDGAFTQLDMRFALHDVIDSGGGYPVNSHIEFMRVRGRYLWEPSKVLFDELAILRGAVYTPQSFFRNKASWRFYLGSERVWDDNCVDCVQARGSYGIGFAAHTFDPHTVYALVDFEFGFSPSFKGSAWRLGAGPAVGHIFNFSPNFKAQFEAQYRYLAFAYHPHVVSLHGEVRYHIANQWSLSARYRQVTRRHEIGGGLSVYF